MLDLVSEADRLDIQASLEGDEEAYARLVRRYENRIASGMWRFTRVKAELEELVQDVFVEAYLSLKGFKGRAPFLHWLRKIGTRVGYRFWKQRRREQDRRANLKDNLLLPVSTPEAMTALEAADTLEAILDRLPPKDRLVLTLMYLEEGSIREVAEQTGWSVTLVKVRAHRARKKLRALFVEAGKGDRHA
ncbi:MAG: RNA polymerase sigma factor [Pseudomonadota bacterium]